MQHILYVRYVDDLELRINLSADTTPQSIQNFISNKVSSESFVMTINDRDGDLWVIVWARVAVMQVLAERSPDTGVVR